MKMKKSLGSKLFDLFNYTFLILIMIVMLYPMLHVAFASVSNSGKLVSHTGLLLHPLGFNLSAYKAVFKNPNILSSYGITIFLVVVGTFLDVTVTCISAFVLSRQDFMPRKFLTVMIVITMYFSGGLIPTYLWISQVLNLSNNIMALILPGLISTWNLLIVRTNFESLPVSLEESAKIDGATDITVFFKIVMPLSKAIISVMVLMYAVGIWNAWFDSMLYIRDRIKYPLQLILREILISGSMQSMMDAGTGGDYMAIAESIKYATIMIATVPVLCVYPFIQKYFTKGVMVGAVKG